MPGNRRAQGGAHGLRVGIRQGSSREADPLRDIHLEMCCEELAYAMGGAGGKAQMCRAGHQEWRPRALGVELTSCSQARFPLLWGNLSTD